ncbi:MAG: hypothetical protein IPL22_12275 [Bacteroidetes bacterium]|nr:hypothetical protein [Bacteroidota bacterium]
MKFPTEPQAPIELIDWIVINRQQEIPVVTFKSQVEKVEKFEESDKRVNEFGKYKEQQQTSLFGKTIPSILEGWVAFINDLPVPIKEKRAIAIFADNNERVKQSKNYKKLIDEFYFKYGTN